MARSETVVTVFVASPSDVLEERKALEAIVNELNKTWSKNLSLRLELIKWETDIYPGISKYPQSVINEQINDEYDIFIAIFWSRVGTPTDKYDSGTIEEIERALKKHQKTEIEFLVYFKDQAIPPSKMDPSQLYKINDLKGSLGDRGSLYFTFENIESFEVLLRTHLSRIAQKWAAKPESDKNALSAKIEAEDSSHQYQDIEDDDYGVLDYLEIYEDRMFDTTSALTTMTEATERIGSQFTKRTEEISQITNGDEVGSKQARRVLQLSSEDLTSFSETIESQVKISSRAREDAFNALSKAISLYVDFEDSDIENLQNLSQSLEILISSASDAKVGLLGFRTSIESLPRLTVRLNKAKKRSVQALALMLGEIDVTIQAADNIVKVINDLRAN